MRRLRAVLILSCFVLLNASAALDPALIGTWTSTDGRSTGRWTVTADGHFFLSITGAINANAQGKFSGSGGRWESVDAMRAVSRGGYGRLADGRIWTQKDGEPRVVWSRVATPTHGVPAAPVSLNAQQQIALNDGLRFKDKEQWDSAIQAFTYAIQRNPSLTQAYYQRGVCWNKLAAYSQNASEKTTRLIPEAIFGRLQYVALAMRDFDTVIAHEPNNAKAICMRGLARLETLQFDDATSDFTRAIQLDPQYAFAYCYRGIAAMDHYKDGSADLRRCYAINPNLRPMFDKNAQDALELREEYRQLQKNLAARYEAAQQWAGSHSSPSIPDSYGESVKQRSALADRYRSSGDSYNANQVLNGGNTTGPPPP